MIDPVLNKSLEETRELQTRWNQFRDFIRMAIERGRVTAEAEMKFLELKSVIAMLHDGFMAKLEHDHKTGQNIMSIVGDAIMLKKIARSNDAEKQKFEFDWNECYLLVNEQVQALESEKERLAGISERAYKASRRKEAIQAKIYNFIHSAGLKWTITAIILVLVLYVVPAHIWSYRQLNGIPGINKVYQLVADYAYRPYLDPDYAFDSWEDVHAVNVEHPDAIRQQDSSQLTKEYFEASGLNEMGFTRDAAAEAKNLIENNTLHYESDRYSADSADARMFYILFKTTDDARRFVDLANKSIAQLTQDQRNAILDKVYVARSANLIAVGISTHPVRSGEIKQKFHLAEDYPNSLSGV